MSDERRRTRLFQFNIRGLATVTLIVALLLAWYRDNSLRRLAERRLSEVLGSSHVWIWSPEPNGKYLAGFGSMVVAGSVFVAGETGRLETPTVKLEVLEPDSMELIGEMHASVSLASPGVYQFMGDVVLTDGSQSLGTKLIRVTCFDREKQVVSGITAMKVVETVDD